MAILTVNVWLDSGANIHSCYRTSFEIDKDVYEKMSESEIEEYVREYAFERADWGWEVEDGTTD